MEFFYSPHISGDRITLDAAESFHCIRVLRHREGDVLFITDGNGGLCEAKLLSADAHRCILQSRSVSIKVNPVTPWIHLAISPLKNADRLEWLLEKATEAGVTEITPILCSRSEKNKLKEQRLQNILLSAMKQSLRLFLPKMNPLVSFHDFVSKERDEYVQKFIPHCQIEGLSKLKSVIQKDHPVLLAIGPEGDFTLDEISLAEAAGFVSVSLSEARLRSETAALSALFTVHAIRN